jgi:cytochrome c-type biogenesis protein
MDGFIASLLAAFAGGALSFLSPCVLPLVPGYLCFAAGLQFSELAEIEEKGEATAKILPGALAFVAGFSAVFISLGAGAAAINPLLIANQEIMAQIAGGAIILLGLHMTHIIQVPFLGREARLLSSGPREKSKAPLVAAFVMGLAFAFGWTPCIGPILATILALAAARDSLGEGVTLLVFYALGLGIPFILAALGMGRFMATSQKIKKNMVWVERGAGGLLIVTGSLIMFGTLQAIASYLLDWFPALSTLG